MAINKKTIRANVAEAVREKKRNTIVLPVEIWINSVTMNVSLEVPQNPRIEVPCYLVIPVLWLSQKFMSDEEDAMNGLPAVFLFTAATA